MRGVGGPLLCIGDLLSDIGDDRNIEKDEEEKDEEGINSNTITASSDPSHLHQLFEDKYGKLIESLEREDHSWTALTLELCAALKTANKLVTSANSNIKSLKEKVKVLEDILKRGNSTVETAKAIQFASNRAEQSIKLN